MTTEQLNVWLTAANVIVAIGSLVTAVVVPFISIWIAHRLTSLGERRNEVRKALVEINQDTQSFRIVVLHCHPANVPQTDSVEFASQYATNGTRQLQDAITKLNGDCIALGLLCGHDADGLGASIHRLISETEALMARRETPQANDVDRFLQESIQRIGQDTKPLWAHIEKAGVFTSSKKQG